MYMRGLPACISAYHVPMWWPQRPEEDISTYKLKLQTEASHFVGAWTEPGVSTRTAGSLHSSALSPAFHF